MGTSKIGRIVLLSSFFLFSLWIFGKSLGYDQVAHEFIIARHQIGDFGLHLSLIRSISWGSNFPVESPFYPGVPMPYHYIVDVIAGLFERLGVRIDLVFNGISAIAFTSLLYVLYLFPQRLFKKSIFMGLVSVALFILPSSLTIFDFIFSRPFSQEIFYTIWRLPDYIHAGPFDGSIISIFFTLNVLLNQRHLVVGLALGVWMLYRLMPAYLGERILDVKSIIVYGLLLGILGYIHSLVFLGVCVFLFFFFIKKPNYLCMFIPAIILLIPRFIVISQVSEVKHAIINPGFYATKPLTLFTFLDYWWQNLGIALIILPLGVFFSPFKQKVFFVATMLLFIIANTFQLSYRIDHNHSLLNMFIIFSNFYLSYFLFRVWRSGIFGKLLATVILITLVSSGVLNLMVVKNDFHIRLPDAPGNTTVEWIRSSTPPKAIMLAPRNILDPVTLSGRYNYLGHDYYLSVMGYDIGARLERVKWIFEASKINILDEARREHIQYVLIPNSVIQDFPYLIDYKFWDSTGLEVYRDMSVRIYKL